VVFPSGYQSARRHRDLPGHSTILTGARPSRTGVSPTLFNLGLAARTSRVYCSEDRGSPGSSSSSYTVSDYQSEGACAGDYMKRATPDTRVAAVAGKDRAAVMMGGKRPTTATGGAARRSPESAAQPSAWATNAAVPRRALGRASADW
jgi:alkaline phosphatase